MDRKNLANLKKYGLTLICLIILLMTLCACSANIKVSIGNDAEDKEVILENIKTDVQAENLKSIVIKSESSTVTLMSYDTDAIVLEMENMGDNYSYSDDDGVFSLELKSGESKLVTTNLSAVTVKVPKDISLDKITIEMGNGDIILSDVDAAKVSVKSGLGSFKNSGALSGEVNIELKNGSADLLLCGSERDYKISADTNIGSVVVGNFHGQRKLAGEGRHTGAEYSSDALMGNRINVHSGDGDVTVKFAG